MFFLAEDIECYGSYGMSPPPPLPPAPPGFTTFLFSCSSSGGQLPEGGKDCAVYLDASGTQVLRTCPSDFGSCNSRGYEVGKAVKGGEKY